MKHRRSHRGSADRVCRLIQLCPEGVVGCTLPIPTQGVYGGDGGFDCEKQSLRCDDLHDMCVRNRINSRSRHGYKCKSKCCGIVENAGAAAIQQEVSAGNRQSDAQKDDECVGFAQKYHTEDNNENRRGANDGVICG